MFEFDIYSFSFKTTIFKSGSKDKLPISKISLSLTIFHTLFYFYFCIFRNLLRKDEN